MHLWMTPNLLTLIISSSTSTFTKLGSQREKDLLILYIHTQVVYISLHVKQKSDKNSVIKEGWLGEKNGLLLLSVTNWVAKDITPIGTTCSHPVAFFLLLTFFLFN